MGDSHYTKGTRVYVGGLCDGIKKEDLETEFEKYGKLNSIWVAFNPPGFAFVEFLNKDEAESACDSLNGADLLGSKLRVEISRGRGRGPRGGGGFRGGSRSGGRSGGGSGYSRNGRNSYGNDRSGGGYRNRMGSGGGGGGGGRGRGRYGSDRGSSGSRYGNDREGSRGGYGNRDGYSRNNYDSGSRYRSRSPVSRGSWQ